MELRKLMRHTIRFDVFVNLRRMKVDLNKMFDLEMEMSSDEEDFCM